MEILKITASSPSVTVLLKKMKEQKLTNFEIISVFSSLSSNVRDSSVLPELIVSLSNFIVLNLSIMFRFYLII